MTLRRSVLTSIVKRQHVRLRPTTQCGRSTCSYSMSETDTLFSYTSGRWLWNEREQLEARRVRFDVPSLQQAACQAVGTERCISFDKIGEGNYNKAYRPEMGNGQRVIAKIPHPNAGPQTLTTSSEVATLEFARNVLNVPVPKVLAWSAHDRNPVRAEYIIMKKQEAPNFTKSGRIFHYRRNVTSFVSL